MSRLSENLPTTLRKMSQKQLQGLRIWVPCTTPSWAWSSVTRWHNLRRVPLNPMVSHCLRWLTTLFPTNVAMFLGVSGTGIARSRTFSKSQVQGTLATWITAAVDQTLWSRTPGDLAELLSKPMKHTADDMHTVYCIHVVRLARCVFGTWMHSHVLLYVVKHVDCEGAVKQIDIFLFRNVSITVQSTTQCISSALPLILRPNIRVALNIFRHPSTVSSTLQWCDDFDLLDVS